MCLDEILSPCLVLSKSLVWYPGVVQIVKQALLLTIEEAVPDKWSLAMAAAWEEAYNHLADVIKAEMRSEREAACASAQ